MRTVAVDLPMNVLVIREEDGEGRHHCRAQRVAGILRIGLREANRRDRSGERLVVYSEDAEADDADVRHEPFVGALRQSRDLYEAQGDRAAVERAAAARPVGWVTHYRLT